MDKVFKTETKETLLKQRNKSSKLCPIYPPSLTNEMRGLLDNVVELPSPITSYKILGFFLRTKNRGETECR